MRFVGVIVESFRALLQWWTGELTTLVPVWLRRVFRPEPARVVLVIGDGRAELFAPSRRGWDHVGPVDLESGSWPELPSGVGKKAKRGKLLTTISIQPASVVSRDVELPVAAEENLREVIGFEMERLTPFKGSDVYYDFRVRNSESAHGKLAVTLSIAARQPIDRLTAAVSSAGFTTDRVDVNAGADGATRGLNLLPPRQVKRPSALQRTLSVVVVLSAFAAAAAAVAVPLDRKARVSASLRAQAVEARANANQVRKLLDEISSLRESGSYLLTLRKDTILVSEVLDTTTRLLPDKTWLVQLRLTDDKLDVGGLSPNSSELISVFEASPLFSDVKFNSSVTQDPARDLERFSLSMRTTGGQAK